MKYLVTAKEMKKYDNTTIQTFQMPGVVLMERAAISVADLIKKRFGVKKTVLILAGMGNNGGDGIALGRILWQRGYEVTFYLCGKEENCSEETKKQIQIIKKYSLSIQTNLPTCEYDIRIDAIFGIGLNRDITGECEMLIRTINQKRGVVISLDIPSGICADTGKLYGVAVKADMTITFAFEKRGQFLFPGNSYCGEIICTDIGITEDSFLDQKPSFVYYEKDDLKRLPKRPSNGNKGTFGKVFLVAGSKDMNGAAALAAKSAYRIGAGMVRVLVKAEHKEGIQKIVPEAILSTYETSEELDAVWNTAVKWADVVAIGPGIGTTKEAKTLVEKAVLLDKPMVFDADALNIIAKYPDLGNRLRNKRVIFTPHLAEFARLLQKKVNDIEEKRVLYVTAFAREYNLTVVCKDANTIVSHKGIENYINTSGNDGMATAGSGDVLTGIIAGLLAQGMTEKEAAMLGVYIHGVAGDFVKEKYNAYSLMASDLIEALKYMLGEKTDETL